MYAVVYDAVADVLETSNITTGFDISAAVYSQNFSVASQETAPNGLAFNTDGTKMFVVGDSGDDVNEYALTTGFDVSTASFTDAFSLSAQDTYPDGIAFNTDGTKMFITGETNDNVYEYALSTGFDVSTASFTDAFDVSGEDGMPWGLTFNADGTKMFVVGAQADEVDEYALSTGFDVSTASFTSVFSVASQDNTPTGIAFNTDGTKMFVLGKGSRNVNEYTVGSTYIPTGYQPCIGSNINTTYWTDINSLTATNAVGDGNVFYAISNDDKTTWSVLDNTSGVRPIARVSGGTWQYNSNTTYGSTTWTSATVNTEIQALRDSMGQEEGFVLADAAYDSVSAGVPETTSIMGLTFNTDGTKMFVLDQTADDVTYYSLSSGFDLSSTVTHLGQYSVAGQETGPEGIAFNTDGTTMFIIGHAGDDVNYYSLSVGFDLTSTVTHLGQYSVASQATYPRAVAFNTDGTKMFVVDGTNVYYYSLSVGFDLSSTVNFIGSYSVSANMSDPMDINFNSDGTLMFLVDATADDITYYSLSVGFDLTSTVSYVGEFSVTSQATSPTSFAFNADGTKMFVLDDNTDTVYQYSTSGLVVIASNQMNSTTLNAITDANQISLGTDLDFAVIMYIDTGTSVPTYSGTAINYDAAVKNQGAILGTDYNFDAPAGDKVRITAVGAGNYKIRVV